LALCHACGTELNDEVVECPICIINETGPGAVRHGTLSDIIEQSALPPSPHSDEDYDEDYDDPWQNQKGTPRMALFAVLSNVILALVFIVAFFDPIGIWEDDDDDEEDRSPWYDGFTWEDPVPLVTLDVIKNADDDYIVRVLKVSDNYDLPVYQFQLLDETGSMRQSGEIELQNLSARWRGIDVTWDDKGNADINPGNRKADRSAMAGGSYTDPAQAQRRIEAIQAGFQMDVWNQKSEGNISVSFTDNDRDGKLTSGDVFHVRGYNDIHHPASDGYSLRVLYDITDDVAGTIRLGSGN